MPNWVVLLQLHFLEQLSLALLRKDRLFTNSQGLVCRSPHTHTLNLTRGYQIVGFGNLSKVMAC